VALVDRAVALVDRAVALVDPAALVDPVDRAALVGLVALRGV